MWNKTKKWYFENQKKSNPTPVKSVRFLCVCVWSSRRRKEKLAWRIMTKAWQHWRVCAKTACRIRRSDFIRNTWLQYNQRRLIIWRICLEIYNRFSYCMSIWWSLTFCRLMRANSSNRRVVVCTFIFGGGAIFNICIACCCNRWIWRWCTTTII